MYEYRKALIVSLLVLFLILMLPIVGRFIGGDRLQPIICECFSIEPGPCTPVLAACYATQTAHAAPPTWWPWGH